MLCDLCVVTTCRTTRAVPHIARRLSHRMPAWLGGICPQPVGSWLDSHSASDGYSMGGGGGEEMEEEEEEEEGKKRRRT